MGGSPAALRWWGEVWRWGGVVLTPDPHPRRYSALATIWRNMLVNERGFCGSQISACQLLPERCAFVRKLRTDFARKGTPRIGGQL